MVSILCRLFYPENNFKSDLERERQFGATFTHTLYYLAQVNAAMGQSEKGAMYCHTTLLRQLETGQYDPVDWALNCATLSQYYITQGNYMLSRHCLGKCRPILVVFINLTSGEQGHRNGESTHVIYGLSLLLVLYFSLKGFFWELQGCLPFDRIFWKFQPEGKW